MRATFAARSFFVLFLVGAIGFADSRPLRAQEASDPPTGAADKTGSVKDVPDSDALAEELDEELERQRAIAERFLVVLQRNPRRGTALDKIYGFHLEAGTLEKFAGELRAEAEKANDGAQWMILGLIESQRGRDAAAIDSLKKATELRPDDAMAPFYLGQAQALVGQPEEAIVSFEQSIGRKPTPSDSLEIFQALGRAHQRAHQTEQALAVWKRLEELFPGDTRVQERIAVALAEEGQLEAALPRYEALAKASDDDYRRVVFQMEAAELKVKLDRAAEGIADLEQALATLNPESWLFREVRRKIEDVFLRTEDREGLAKYYATWLDKHPDDVDAMARLAKSLAAQARIPEARERLDQALKLAPSRTDLRLTFIAQLVEGKNFAAALEQYEKLDELDPGNPDHLRAWGKLHLRDDSRSKEEREKAAAAVWRRIVDARPDDPLLAAQTADLFRQAEVKEEALALYEKAVELAPQAPQYREYLGEYLHILERRDEAVAVWRAIAEGDHRTAENLARLAEVLARFGYLKEALPEIAAACELDPKNFALHLAAADLRSRAEAYDEALASLDAAKALAQNDEERESILSRQIRTLQSADRLETVVEELEATITDASPAEAWFLLARHREALRSLPEAAAAIEQALVKQPGDIRSLDAAARIAESSGELEKAADLNRKLVTVDRRGRTTYLERIASLESQLGRIDAALAAGRDLIASAPGNVDAYQFFADLCARLDRPDEGIEALRRAARVNPHEPNLLLSLAAALADRFRTDEAIEIYWQAYEKSGSLDDRLLVIGKQADLYLQTNRFDQLLERLERGRAEPETRREATICLAQAYHSAGDYGMARQELESLLGENSRDTQLLLQLSKLAESEADLAGAIEFQERLAEVAPGAETEYRLATLLGQNGDDEKSAEILVRLSAAEEDPAKLMRNVDRLLSTDKAATALRIVQAKLGENPQNWELLTREGVALFRLEREDEAAEAFRKVLSLSLPSDEKSVIAPSSTTTYYYSPGMPTGSLYQEFAQDDSELERLSRELGLDPRYGAGYSPMQQFPVPTRFGSARSSALAWNYLIARKQGKEQEYLTSLREKAESEEASEEELVDWYRLRVTVPDQEAARQAARLLVQRGLARGRFAYLRRLRTAPTQQMSVRAGSAAPSLPPLSNEDIELALDCYEALDAADGDAAPPAYVTTSLIAELDRAGRTDEADEILARLFESTTSAGEAASVLSIVASRKEAEDVRKYFDRFAHLDLEARRQKSSNRYPASYMADSLAPQSLDVDEILDLFDAYLDWQSASTAMDRERSKRRTSGSTAMRSFSYQYWSKGVPQIARDESTLVPADRFDTASIIALRNVYERCKDADRLEDFEARLAKVADDPDAATRDVRLYALAYVARWKGDEAETAEAIRRCAELSPQDFELRMVVARYHAGAGDLDEALAVIDSVSPTDQRATQERETLALDLAVRLGDRERATTAARRLFGLRLPSETQVALASQMRRLGLNDEADAALSRAQRQAGGRIPALAALMGQYRAQGDNEVAAEVAYRILQRSRPAKSSSSPYVSQNSDEIHRQAALQCLLATGELDKAIAALEEQIARTPEAAQLYERLAEYVRAKGDVDKEMELLKKLCDLNPKDANVRAELARRATSRGKHKEACDAYLEALAIDPNVMERDYYQIPQMFQQAQRMPDLAKAFETLDLSKIRQPYYVVNIVESFMRSDATRAAGIALLKRAAKELPNNRAYLWQSLDSAQALEDPELLDLAVESVIFDDGVQATGPWAPFPGSIGHMGDGRIRLGVEPLIDALRKANRTPGLLLRLDNSLAKRPDWSGGKALKLWIEFPDLDAAAATARMEELFGDREAPFDQGEFYTRWGLVQLLATKPELKSYAAETFAAMEDDSSFGNGFSYSPRAAAYRIYKELGRTDEAIAILKTAIPERLPATGSDPYQRANIARQLTDLGQSLLQAGEPVEAVRAYARLLAEPSLVAPDVGRSYTSDPDYFKSSATRGLESAIAAASAKGISSEEFISLIETSFSEEGSSSLALIEREGKGDEPSRLFSPILDLLSKVGADDQPALEQTLAKFRSERPDDYGVAVAATIVSLRDLDDPRATEASKRLVELVERTPLSSIETGRRPSAKQRNEATPQIGLWLVARRAYANPELRDAAKILADRSVEAAARQSDPRFLHSILLERGMLAHDAGDVAAAEAVWTDLLDRLFPPLKATESGEAALVPPATMSQFETAAALAVLAGDRGSQRISFDAMRRALAGGLPVSDMPADLATSSSGVVRSVSRSSVQSQEDPALKLVGESLHNASFAWRRGDVSADEASRALEAIVFPVSRPKEILFLPSERDLLRFPPQSVAAELASWAAAAGRDAEIAKAVAARGDSPETKAAGLALLALIALEQGDAKLLEERLGALAGLWDRLSSHAQGVAAHAPLAAVADPKFEKIAGPFAEKAAVALAEAKADGRSSSPTSSASGELSWKLVALRAKAGDAEAALELAEKFLEFRRREFLRYGDYGYTLVRNEQAGFAAAIASAGDAEATLSAIGRYFDAPVSQQNVRAAGGEIAKATGLLLTQLGEIEPQRRYELLRDWTLPTSERKTLRVVTLPQPTSQLPEEFRSEDAPTPTPTPFDILATFAWLVDAAKEAGTLDELRAKVLPLKEAKLADADLLLLLIDIESNADAAKADLAALIEEAKKRPDERPQDESPEQTRSAERQRLEALAAVTAMQKPALVDAGTTLLEELTLEYDKRNNSELRMLASKHLARRYAQRAGGDAKAIFESPGLAYWHAESGSGIASGPAAPIFVAHDGVVAHLAGDGMDRLFFKYPLGGEFSVTFESTVGWAKQAELGFGATVCESRPWEKCVYVYDAVHRDSLRRAEIPSRWENGWDRTEVRISPDSIRWYVHGQLAFEDPNPAPASPWLYLSVVGERKTRLRNLRIEGNPLILQEVPLIVGNSLDGWQSLEGAPTSTRLSAAEAKRLAAEGQTASASQPQRVVQQLSEWSAADGTLTSLPSVQRSPYRTNALSYFRPLQAGETLSYEFFYEPGVAAVHPALGMTAFVLGEEGVTLRLATLSMTGTEEGYGRSTKDEASADVFRRGPERVPLRPGEWNQAEVRMEQDRLSVVLNDELILEKPATLAEDRRFGFFRQGESDEVRVRNVVLRGDWPEAFPQEALDDALAFEEEASREVRLARHAAVGENYYLDGAYDVYRRGQELPPEARYEFLAKWVLPSADHPTLRTVVTKTPLDPPSLEGLSPEGVLERPEVSGPARVHRGAEAASPALELVRTAKETGRLDELEAEIVRLAASQDSAIDNRAVEAMLVAIDLAGDRFASATARLKKLRETAASVPPERGILERGPDALALFAALERPEMLEEARTTAAWLVEKASAPGTSGEWNQFMRREWGVARAMNDPASGRAGESAPTTLLHWQPVALPTARTRADGRPASKWRVTNGEVEYLGGNADDALYFSTPLAGDFDVVCEVHNGEYREMRLLYDGASIFLQRGGLNVRFAPHGRGFRDVPTKVKLKLEEWVEVRLSVRGQEMIVSANGQEAFRTPLNEKADPWFAFMTKLAFTHGAVRNFRIEGTPTIPREVELFAGPKLVGGAAVYYEESVGGEPANWQRVDGEIRAEQYKDGPGRFSESVLQYHRPMLEDGEIEYEFFWGGGKTEVYPALDRFVFVLRPEGVAAHAMTDQKWDPDHAKPDEIVPLPGAVPVPLKENDWNKARLVLQGDVATLFVNDEKVAERQLPPTNQRTFGLFRWAHRTGVRVRNVIHRGAWPTELPPAEERSFVLAP